MFYFCYDIEPARGVACLFLFLGLFLLSFFQVLNLGAGVAFLGMLCVSFLWNGRLRYEAAFFFAAIQGFVLLSWSVFLSVMVSKFISSGDPYSKKYLPTPKFGNSSLIAIIAFSFFAGFHSFYAAWVFRCFRKFLESKVTCQV